MGILFSPGVTVFEKWVIDQEMETEVFEQAFRLSCQEDEVKLESMMHVVSLPPKSTDIMDMYERGMDRNAIAAHLDGEVGRILQEHVAIAYEEYQIWPHADGLGRDVLFRMVLPKEGEDVVVVVPLDDTASGEEATPIVSDEPLEQTTGFVKKKRPVLWIALGALVLGLGTWAVLGQSDQELEPSLKTSSDNVVVIQPEAQEDTTTQSADVAEAPVVETLAPPVILEEEEDVAFWSSWYDELPSGITEADYEIDTANLYRYRDLQTTESFSSSMSGWTVYDTSLVDGDYSDWSSWSTSKPMEYETRQVESQVEYRYRDLQTTESTSSSLSGWTRTGVEVTYGSWGSWSSWSTTKYTDSDIRDVDTDTEYRYRTMDTRESSYELSGSWELDYVETLTGNWSAWTEDELYMDDDTQVETRTVDGETTYVLGHFCAVLEDGTCDIKSYRLDDTYTYHELGTFTDLSSFSKSGSTYSGGGSCGNGSSDWFIISEKSSKITQYRSREVELEYHYYRWDDWSDYDTDKVTETSTREVETRTIYRYRDREEIRTYSYEKWGDWSSWSTTKVNASSTRDVSSQTVYRYRDLEQLTVYHYERWTDWSSYVSTIIEAIDGQREVETKLQYRYKEKE